MLEKEGGLVGSSGGLWFTCGEERRESSMKLCAVKAGGRWEERWAAARPWVGWRETARL